MSHATPPAEYLPQNAVEALVRASANGHAPQRAVGEAHWSCPRCGYVAEQPRWWPLTCTEKASNT